MFPLTNTPLLIGHRGAPVLAPENTIESFEAALANGADGLELDLHLTSDGVLVVHHDPVVGDAAITRMTWPGFREKVTGGIRFEEVLEFLQARPSAYLNIELKHAVPEPDEREVRLAAVLREWQAPAKARTWISSFDPHSLLRLRRHEVEVPLALVAYDEVQLDLLPCLPVDAIHAYHGLVTAERIAEWRGRGYAVLSWTVNDRAIADRLFGLGVDGIFGDDPKMMLAARTSFRGR